jgi:N-acetylglucosaminyldiphosphoundecaprenol N-acetyl-beta-D-mannosaminyltransferase
LITDRKLFQILGAFIDVISWDETLSRISGWSLSKESRTVCICNVHSVVTATQDPEFGRVVNEADIATPDGAPVAWMLRRMGQYDQQRINGPDLMWRYCDQVQHSDQSIFFYGSTEETLIALKLKLLAAFPSLKIAGAISPPFRTLTLEEDASIVEQINDSGAGVVWVSLGCPKQELWMASHRGQINAVMVGVGAAFDYHAGTIKRAPKWMQDSGLEWLYRLISEPRRLYKRYLITNTLFIIGAIKQLVRLKLKSTL